MKKDYSKDYENCGDDWNWYKPICKKCVYYESDREISRKNDPYVIGCIYTKGKATIRKIPKKQRNVL